MIQAPTLAYVSLLISFTYLLISFTYQEKPVGQLKIAVNLQDGGHPQHRNSIKFVIVNQFESYFESNDVFYNMLKSNMRKQEIATQLLSRQIDLHCRMYLH